MCEIEVEDVLAKSNLHIDKAIALNASEDFHKLYLEPLKRIITVKMNLYDEPTSGLDPVNAGIIRNLISEAAKGGKGFIIVTH